MKGVHHTIIIQQNQIVPDCLLISLFDSVHQTSLSTLEKWAESRREHKLLVLNGRCGDWYLCGWGTEHSLWYWSLALEEDIEEGCMAPVVEEMAEGDETEEEEVGRGT